MKLLLYVVHMEAMCDKLHCREKMTFTLSLFLFFPETGPYLNLVECFSSFSFEFGQAESATCLSVSVESHPFWVHFSLA